VQGSNVENGHGVIFDSILPQGEVRDNRIHDNAGIGIFVKSSEAVTVSGNSVENQKQSGIFLDSAPLAQVSGNTVRGNDDGGIVLKTQSDGALISENILDANSLHGLFVESSIGIEVRGNTITGSLATASKTEMTGNGIVFSLVREEGNGVAPVAEIWPGRIEANTLTDNNGIGIYLNDSQVQIVDNQAIDFNGCRGINVDNKSYVEIRGNTLDSNIGDGIYINASTAIITENSITKTFLSPTATFCHELSYSGPEQPGARYDGDGIIALGNQTSTNSGFAVTIAANNIAANSRAGIVSSGSTMDIHDNELTGNVESGLALLNLPQEANVRGNTIHDNGINGILCNESAPATIQTNQIMANLQNGIAVLRVGNDGGVVPAPVRIEENTIQENKNSGILLSGVTIAALNHNTLNQNTTYDLLCLEQGGVAVDQCVENTINIISGCESECEVP
jgi:parallel beta-helix repeat protein